jgi:hypothetical protein
MKRDMTSSERFRAAPYHRYLFHSDHSIPPGVSLANYAFAVELAKKYGSYR